jgi:hypothetical protein
MPSSAADTVRQILLERGPLDGASLLAEARRAGLRLNAKSLGQLLHDGAELPAVVCLLDGRHGLLDGMLAGRVFTHRLTEDEIAQDVLVPDPDLLMLRPLLDAGADVLTMPGGAAEWGSDVELDRWVALEDAGFAADDVVALPSGTLSGWAPGSVIGLALAADGARLFPVQPGQPPADLADRISELIGEFGADGDEEDETQPMPVPVDDLVAALCDRDATLFAEPLAPLGELLEELGFITVDGDVAGTDFDVDGWHAATEVADLAATFRIPVDHAMAVSTISTVVRTLTDAISETSTEELAKFTYAGDRSDAGEADSIHRPGTTGTGLAAVVDIHSARRGTQLPDLVRLFRALHGGDLAVLRDGESLVTVTGPLQHPATAQALLADALGVEREPAVALGAVAETWEPIAPHAARVALRWIRARCQERLGHADLAETTLDEARALGPDWPPVLEDLARYAADRGDVERAISLLRRAGVPADDEELMFLQGLSSPARPDLGRNKPCWCGSGRKYKVCHLGKEGLPLEARAGWLYRKMINFAGEGPYRMLMMELADRRSAYRVEDLALLEALRDPLVIDAVLFEGGAAADFLTERGYLLPDDERALTRSWLDAQRSVFEVEQVRSGHGFRARNLRTGELHDITERTASRVLRKGQRLLMRVVPVGRTWQIFGGAEPLPMSMDQGALELCDALADGTAGPAELVSFATSRFAPPELRTTDGQPMVFCTAHYRVDDRATVTAELDRRFDAAGDDRWSRSDGDGKHPTVLGSVELGPDELTLTAMNEQRFRALQDELARIDGLTLIDVDRTPATEMMRRVASGTGEQSSGGGAPGQGGDGGAGRHGGRATSRDNRLEDGPEVQALLEEYARDYEQQWLDMSLPALGGATPRQAADDPTRREDLVRLLDSFDDIDAGPGAMQVSRLRAALGL